MIPYSRKARTSRRLKATDQSAFPVAWESRWIALSTQGLCGTMKTKSTSHHNKQHLGKIGQLRTKSPTSLKLVKMPYNTRSTYLQHGLTWKNAFDKVWEKGTEIEIMPVWCCWANVQMDWTVHAQQESKSPGNATLEETEDPQARRPTQWSAVSNSVPCLHL